MPLRITNTLTGKKEDFQPMKAGEASLYTCGPTVYGLTHIGNARPPVFFDVVRRFMETTGLKVTWVMNFTDVDDKIINKAREQKTTWDQIATWFTAEYLKDLSSLGVRLPTHQPKVSESIEQIITLIGRLILNESAYVAEDGEVFFSVRSFEKYGKLSGKKIDDLLVGVRVSSDEKKRDPLDFSLWKPQKSPDEPVWKSPWGAKGRPGWHIECSAMALQYLGETFDIHGGGLDLIHPHHENEIAQSEAATGSPFARIWMHNNLISMNKEKMSKSLGNIFLTRDFIAKYTAETLRYLLLSVHYRSPVEFSEQHIREIQSALHRVYSAKKKASVLANATPGYALPEAAVEKFLKEQGDAFDAGWKEAMADDFNVPRVLALVFDYVRAFNACVDRKGFKPTDGNIALAKRMLTHFTELSRVLNLFGEDPVAYLAALRATVLDDRGLKAEDIEAKITARREARAAKNFTEADSIRGELLKLGIEMQDTPTGTDWDVVFTSLEPKS
jgi:cysteinyl-tRNA synthetase